jgi:hypothetical protein
MHEVGFVTIAWRTILVRIGGTTSGSPMLVLVVIRLQGSVAEDGRDN